MKLFIYTLFIILCVPLVYSATPDITINHYDDPDFNITLISGGSLEENITYFYRVMRSNNRYLGISGTDWLSKPSIVKNLTINSTHKSINISFDATGYWYVYVAKGTNPGIGNWNNMSYNVSTIETYHTANIACVGFALISDFLDDGTNHLAYTIGSYTMYLAEHARDQLLISNGTISDPITFRDVYLWCVENNCTETAFDRIYYDDIFNLVIQNNIYVVKAHSIHFLADSYLYDYGQIITGMWGALMFYGDLQFGQYEEENGGYAHNGMLFQHNVKGTGPGGNIFFYGNTSIYDTDFKMKRVIGSTSVVGSFYLWTDDYHIIDIKVDGGYGRGLAIYGGANTSSITNAKMGYNRWETNTLYASASLSTFTNMNYYMNANSGPWFVARNFVDEYTFKGLTINSRAASRAIYGSCNRTPNNDNTRLNLIDSYIWDWTKINWYLCNSLDTAFIKRQYSMNIRVLDLNQSSIQNANVTLKNNNSEIVYSILTNGTGFIVEQYLTAVKYVPTQLATHFQEEAGITRYNPFTLSITKDGYQDYNSVFSLNEAYDSIITLEPYPFVIDGTLVINPYNTVVIRKCSG